MRRHTATIDTECRYAVKDGGERRYCRRYHQNVARFDVRNSAGIEDDPDRTGSPGRVAGVPRRTSPLAVAVERATLGDDSRILASRKGGFPRVSGGERRR